MTNMKTHLFIFSALIFSFSCGNEEKNEPSDSEKKNEKEMSYEEREMMEMKEMAEKQKSQPQENPYKDAKIEVKVFKNDTVKQETKYTGYGYDIYVFGARQVSQPHMPGMPGISGFKTEADAKKVGDFIAYKIRNNIMPPSVTVNELDSLGVLSK